MRVLVDSLSFRRSLKAFLLRALVEQVRIRWPCGQWSSIPVRSQTFGFESLSDFRVLRSSNSVQSEDDILHMCRLVNLRLIIALIISSTLQNKFLSQIPFFRTRLLHHFRECHSVPERIRLLLYAFEEIVAILGFLERILSRQQLIVNNEAWLSTMKLGSSYFMSNAYTCLSQPKKRRITAVYRLLLKTISDGRRQILFQYPFYSHLWRSKLRKRSTTRIR